MAQPPNTDISTAKALLGIACLFVLVLFFYFAGEAVGAALYHLVN
ncbi:hypothetical protein [Erythrobacter sp. F6033]|nr:hypothetical protein [Erythrobacter sp. F6033]